MQLVQVRRDDASVETGAANIRVESVRVESSDRRKVCCRSAGADMARSHSLLDLAPLHNVSGRSAPSRPQIRTADPFSLVRTF